MEAGPEQIGQDPYRLQLVSHSLQMLETINKPVAVISICGPLRSGKSYFLSRLLGMKEAFKLGHSMQACTRGIWMATSVLECDEFAVILLDTEGIDDIGSSQTTAMSLLTLATLLSSYLIYNSKRVPQKVDLRKMKCFTQLSSSLLLQDGQSMKAERMKMFFPHFLWLLRDVTLQITDRAGQIISANEYLHNCLLVTESGELTELGQSFCCLFPSTECYALPMPTVNPKFSKNIFKEHDNLNPKFNASMKEIINHILQKVSPKVAVDGVSTVDGLTFAALIRSYVEEINTPGTMPDLEQGWQAIVKWRVQEVADKLVEEYQREMEHSIKNNLPMEEGNLSRIHEQTKRRKMELFQKEIYRVDPLCTLSEKINIIFKQLEQAICQTDDQGEVCGGVFFQFTTQNYSKSQQNCEEVLSEVVEKSKIRTKFDEAIIKSVPLDPTGLMVELESEYYKQAVGPAAKNVFEGGCQILHELAAILLKIPGPPCDIKTIGVGPDRVKLMWKPPKENPDSAEIYVVEVRSKLLYSAPQKLDQTLETRNTKILITGLEYRTTYQIQIRATNELIKSTEKKDFSQTGQGRIGMGLLSGLLGIRYTAAAGPLGLYCLIKLEQKTAESMEARARVGKRGPEKGAGVGYAAGFLASFLLLPVNLAISPITAPVGAAVFARHRINTRCYFGDLTPVSDDES